MAEARGLRQARRARGVDVEEVVAARHARRAAPDPDSSCDCSASTATRSCAPAGQTPARASGSRTTQSSSGRSSSGARRRRSGSRHSSPITQMARARGRDRVRQRASGEVRVEQRGVTPSFAMPAQLATYSGRFSMQSATTSPRARPAPRAQCASWFARAIQLAVALLAIAVEQRRHAPAACAPAPRCDRRRVTRPLGLCGGELRQAGQQARGEGSRSSMRRRLSAPAGIARPRDARACAALRADARRARRRARSSDVVVERRHDRLRQRVGASRAARQRRRSEAEALDALAPSGTGRARGARGSAARRRAPPSSWCRLRRGAPPRRRGETARRARASPPRARSREAVASAEPGPARGEHGAHAGALDRVEHEARRRGRIRVGHAAEAEIDGRLAPRAGRRRASPAAAPASKGCRQPITGTRPRRSSGGGASSSSAASSGAAPHEVARTDRAAPAPGRAPARHGVDHTAQSWRRASAMPTRPAGSARAAARRAATRRASGTASAAATGSRR